MDLATPSERYTLSTQRFESRNVQLNGRIFELQSDDNLPAIKGAKVPSGRMTLDAQRITFLAIPDAGDEACGG